MALVDSVFASTRRLTYEVRIYTTKGTTSGANVLLLPLNATAATGTPGVGGIRISKSFDAPVPVCTLHLNRVSSWITRGMGVTVDVGYDGAMVRLFTGFVQDRARSVGAGDVNCMGRLWSAFRTVQIGQRSVDGVTVSSAIGTILDYVGITTNRALTVPAFTLGTASSPVLERMPASQMLQMLMDIDGCRIYETGTGLIVVAVVDEQPAPTAFRTYTSNANATARILEASDREDPEYYRNRVIVTGATITEGVAPDQTSRTISATATNVGSELVQPALPSGTFIDAEYNNHLIDTDAKAASVALRLLSKFARIPRQLQIEIAGDPELELGQTIGFVMPEIDLNDRGFISGIEHTIDEQGYKTRLTDFRGAGDTGGTLAQNPIAAFTFKSEREVFGSAVNVVASLDATNSFDPDGTIASLAWSDNQTTTPEVSTFTGRRVTVRADTSAWTGTWDVTLTVTDNAGLTGAVTITIPYKNTDAEIVIPAIYAAINNRESASLDGAITWNDQTVGSGNAISVGARPADGTNSGFACYGTSTGRIYRTTNGCATAPTLVYTSAAAVAINDVVWDWRNPALVWAIDENCILYISLDYGVTWGIYGGAGLRTTLGLAGALGNKIGLPAAGGVYIYGGTGAGTPLIAFDAALTNNWAQVTMLGDPVTDFTGSDATMRIVDYSAPGFAAGTEAMILSWTSSVGYGVNLTAVYSTVSTPGTSRTFTRASTAFGSLKTGRYIVGDNPLTLTTQFYCGFANRSIWSSTDGIAWTETTNFLPVGVTAFHALFMSDVLTGIPGLFGVFMFAASDGIYKWTSGEATASYLRPSAAGATWPASAIGKKIAIGASGAAVAGGNRLFSLRASAALKLFDGSSNWTARGSGGGTHASTLLNLGGGHWVYLDNPGDSGDVYHSSDDGVTFATVTNVTHDANVGCFGLDVSADGTVWAVMGSQSTASGAVATKPLKIWKSVDHGATFTLSFTDPGFSTGFNTPLWSQLQMLAADKLDANNVVVMCTGNVANEARFIYTVNGGSSWTYDTSETGLTRGSANSFSQICFVNNHRLLYLRSGTTTQIYYADLADWSAWTASATSFSADVGRSLGPYRLSWGNKCVIGVDPSGAELGRVWRTADNGVTWTDVMGADVGFTIDAIEYDPSADVIYIAHNTTSEAVAMITGAYTAPVKTDITLNSGDGPSSVSVNFLALPR